LAKSPLAVLKVLTEAHTEEAATFLEQDSHSTKFRLSAHFVLWESCWGCHPKLAFLWLAPLEKSTHEKRFTAMKKYNTSHRYQVIKTRLTEEEFAELFERVALCKMSQAVYTRQALNK
jgi:hypothetical protein